MSVAAQPGHRRRCCWSAATRSSHGRPQPGLVLRRERLPAAPRRPAADRSACGSASTSARWRRASGSSRCSTSSATSSSARRGAARVPGPARIRFEASASATTPAGRCCTTSTSTSRPGSTVALIGPTGCGKTTLTTLIPRFYDVRPGTDRGRRRRRARRHAATRSARHVGIVSQDTFLFSTTVAENIAYGTPEATPEQIVHGGPPGAGPRVHLRPARRLRDPRRRARPDALGRPAAADRDRPRAADEPARPHPRRRHRVGRRLHRGPDQAGAARGDEGPDDADHRPPALARSRWPTRWSCWTSGRIVARGTHDELVRDERRLPPDPRPRAGRPHASSTSTPTAPRSRRTASHRARRAAGGRLP